MLGFGISRMVSSAEIELLLKGLELLSSLTRRLTKEQIRSALEGPILLEGLPERPSWLQVEEFIKLNRSFLATPDRRFWWKNRRKSPAYQMKLIRAFEEEAGAGGLRNVYVFSPGRIAGTRLGEAIAPAAAGLAGILTDRDLTGKKRREAIVELVKEKIR